MQRLYVFFSESPHRWDFLKKYANLQFSLKSLCITRWSIHHDSVKALKNGYSDILKTLNYIYEESEEKLDCKRETNILFKKLIKLENAILTIIWEEVLERFNKVSQILQTPGLDVSEGYELIFSLELFVKEMRKNSEEKMNEFEKKAKNLSEEITGNYNDLNKRRKTHIFNGKDKFRVEVYNVLFDSLANELSKRGRVYKQINKKYKFLLNIGKKDHSHIDMESINYVISFYNNDIDAGLINVHNLGNIFKLQIKKNKQNVQVCLN